MQGQHLSVIFVPATAAVPEPFNPPPSQPAPAALSPAVSAPPQESKYARVYKEAEIDKLLKLLVQRKGSDLHLSSGEKPIFRIDGDIKRMEEFPVTAPADAERMLYQIMEKRYRQDFESDNDTDMAYEIPGVARFRVNIFLDRKGMGGVFRVIPTKVVTVEDLNISMAIQNLCNLNKGLVLVTGPTGSGKSTTLCALVDLVNRTRSGHVITLEDPIEFVHENKKCLINQREVGPHTASFKNALRAALREDPNIVLVGEMRDLETVSIAIETAETGHLVFGTLHTSTAASTVDRVIEQFPADRQEQIRIMLSESLKGVVSQTLCKKIGGGRIAAMEILLGIPAVSNLIRESKTYQLPSIIQTNRKMGMVSLNESLMELVNLKKVEAKEAYMKALDKPDILNQLKRDGHSTAFMDEVK
ncbi:type IV pilus twitching motility protein PilT [candidate division TA06 bacterium]|uniref:Type IV pilus twitching motility protein PilT n=1 Tax=candidate division TA06 bacterium TaxID=2250710 RepID=A0A933I9N7_UNCT6|nr:type IV pilus twitching motility protein PilT [candidate division TA06 bacterium]